MNRTRTLGVLAAIGALALTAAPVLGHDESTEKMEMPSVEVGGVEYAFLGLPTSVPAGTEITFRNDGAEIHEIFIARIADDTTESLEELLAMGDEAMASGKVIMVGEGPLVTGPASTAMGSLVLEEEGEHVAICFVPQGFDPVAMEAAGLNLEELGPDMDMSTMSDEALALLENPPHFVAGMIQPFTVTAAGTEMGPLPAETMEEEAA